MANRVLVEDYRKILRHLRKLPSFKHTNVRQILEDSLSSTIVGTNRNSCRNLPADKIDKIRNEVIHNYATLVTSVNELTFLRSLDSGEKLDPRDKIRATAARVGLGVPKFSDDDDVKVSSSSQSGNNKR